jgi:tryptophanyl-tRNA synthetase
MAASVVLTGIKPTGTPHLGNYLGAIRPALDLAEQFEAYYFIANQHALNSVADPAQLRRHTLEVAATWLALGLDPHRVTLYRQSDVPETFELFAILANVTPKGLLNRAHAYKAAVARNREQGRDEDEDAGINMGLFAYPLLMAADILLLSADLVPVGRDQVQHLEITRAIARVFNGTYGEVLRVPEAHLSHAPSIVGLDGRKMSKSYQNTIPLLIAGPDELRKAVRRYRTDSAPAHAPKDPDASPLFEIFQEVAPAGDTAQVKGRLLSGEMTWGELKDSLVDVLDGLLAGPRAVYRSLLADPAEVDRILVAGGSRARARAEPLLARVRAAVGLTLQP